MTGIVPEAHSISDEYITYIWSLFLHRVALELVGNPAGVLSSHEVDSSRPGQRGTRHTTQTLVK